MRVLLRVFVLATAAVAWAAGAQGPTSARAALSRASGGAVAAYAHGPQDALLPEPLPTPLDEGREGSAGATRPGIADAAIVLREIVPQPVDAVSVEVIVIDGESGEVLRCATTTVRRGPEGTVTFDVAAPDGYISFKTGERRVKGYVSRRADRVRVIEPLRREADIRVRVADVAGRPVEGAKVTEVLREGGPPPIIALASAPADIELPVPEEVEVADVGPSLRQAWSEPTGADGWTRVRGVPHLLDERYWVVVGKGDVEAFTEFRLGAFGERHASEILLPVASTRTVATNSAIGIGGGCGGGVRNCGGRRRVPATLEVLVRQQDGRMAAGLKVRVGTKEGTTDAWGRVTFEGLRPGSYDIDVRDPDFVWSKECVDLSGGEWRTFVFSERPGWRARAVLLDSVGRPVPFARVTIDSQAPVAYVRLENGVQDLAFYTDANGTISFPGLHHAPASLSFFYGSRGQSVTLEEIDPFATVRLPPP